MGNLTTSTRTSRAALAAVGVSLVLSVTTTGGASSEQPDPTGEVTHIGVIVADVQRAAAAYAALAGVDTPTITSMTHGLGIGPARTARVGLSNVSVELIQPDEATRAHPHGVHHVGLRGDAANVDLSAELGIRLEYGAGDHAVAPVTTPPLQRPTCITHLGIVVRDMEQARQSLADALGVASPTVRQFDEPGGRAEYTAFNLGNVSIELLRQVDATGNYASFLSTGGPRPHHIALHLRRANDSLGMGEQIAWLEEHNGVMAVESSGFAYLDLRPQLGLFVEALAPESSDRVYPHPHPIE